MSNLNNYIDNIYTNNFPAVQCWDELADKEKEACIEEFENTYTTPADFGGELDVNLVAYEVDGIFKDLILNTDEIAIDLAEEHRNMARYNNRGLV